MKAIGQLIDRVLDALLPRPEPRPIPVRVDPKHRR